MELEEESITPSGLSYDNLDRFYLLPTELQCLILSYSLDLRTLLALEETSHYYSDLVHDCVTILAPGRESSQEVTADFIVTLPNLIRCDYPISIRHLDDLFRIADHPHLRYATLHLAKLVEISSQEQQSGEYQQWSFLPIFLARLQTHHGSISCSTCQGPRSSSMNREPPSSKSYHYNLVISPADALRITESSLIIKRAATANLVLPLYATIPICRYQGPVESNYRDKILAIPCLRLIKTLWDRLTFETYLLFQQEGKRVSLGRVEKDWQENHLPNNYLPRLGSLIKYTKEPYTGIYDFMPITLEYLDGIKSILPDLRVVHLLIRVGEKIPWRDLQSYRRIILYLHKGQTVQIPPFFQKKVEIRM